MTQKSDRPVVLVTGGGSGIGAAIARRLAASHNVAICGRRKGLVDTVAAEIGGVAFGTDLADATQVAALIGHTVDHFGRLDAVVLNAGVVLPSPVVEMSLSDWQQQITVNLTAPFLLAQAALPHLFRTKGNIVAISSAAAHATGAGLVAYSASKAGLLRLIQTIAFENARHGIRANVLSPGWVRTEMGDTEMASLGGSAEEGYRLVTRHVPQRRAATPDEIAGVVRFLLSGDASFVNGAVIPVDGGSSVVDVGMLAFDTD